MQDKITNFFLKYDGVALDYDGVNGPQCVDVAEAYNVEVLGGSKTTGNAIDYATNYPKDLYDWVANTPDNFPQLGDVVVWGSNLGPYGHIAVCLTGNSDHFISFDQNFPLNSSCHFQDHHYGAVLGWLRPKVTPVVPPSSVVTDQTKLITTSDGELEWGTIKSLLSDRKRDLTALQVKVDGYLKQIGDDAAKIGTLQSQLEAAQSQPGTTTVYIPKPEPSKVPVWIRKIFGDSV